MPFNSRPFVSSLALLLAVAWIALPGCQKTEKKVAKAKPLDVFFVSPLAEEVTEYEEFTGRTAATEVIELRARVSGYLNDTLFDEGTIVKKGKPLFKIDPRPFAAEHDRTAAAVAQYEARAKRLQNQERRSRALFEKQALSQDEFETVKFDLDEAQATLSAMRASHEIAKLNLQFTSVNAPITGRIGRKLIDIGNLVAADQTLLATIVPLDRVFVYFDMDERTVLRLRRLEQQGMISSAMKEETIVDIALADAEAFSLQGRIDFEDNQIDSATGTLRVRATLDNPDGLLSPGLFVRVRYPIGKAETSILIPEEALSSDQGRPYVFVLTDKNTVDTRSVVLGSQVGNRRVIRSGLELTDRVAVTGLQRLRRNMEVTPKDRVLPEAKKDNLAAEPPTKSDVTTKVASPGGAR